MNRLLRPVAILAAAVMLGVICYRRQGREQRALAELPADERVVIYTREMLALQALCGSDARDEALDQRCRDRASFMLKFPECDSACRAIAERQIDQPRR